MNTSIHNSPQKNKEIILCQECKNEFMHESEEASKPSDKVQCLTCGTTLALTQKETREGKGVWRTKPIPEEK